MRPVRTLTGTIKFTWARSESMKWLHETGTRLQIGVNVYMKHAGSSYFSFLVCFIVPFIVKCSTAKKNTAESEQKGENYSVSSPHKHSSCKRKDRIPKNQTSLIFFRLFPVIRHLGMVQQHSCTSSKQWSLTGLKSVRVYMVPWSDFRPVRVIRVCSATGMSETGMRWFFRPASCNQKQAFVWRPIWSRTGLM